MTDQTVDGANNLVGEEKKTFHGLHPLWNSPYTVFPALILLLIMPLSIIFHPAWIVPLAEIYVVGMMITIIRLTRG
ncbi:hypothetical protein [Azospirillum soli]|uniref:hypothetical protein n=1 Tax=Azospirillum soli TaxID=1304799 RepID=UPI001AE998E5|nr:hypothetical protein [Azospirillum soli]MBP2315211.1 hypothetical protein [Azospirillum soli]